jgi:hypothetical protein
MSFVDDFATHADAVQFALAQGMDWVNGTQAAH